MIQRSGGARFQLESPQPIAVEGKRRRQDLERHIPPNSRVTCSVDLPHPPGPDRGDDFVRPEARTNADCHEERRNYMVGAFVTTDSCHAGGRVLDAELMASDS